MIKENRSDIQEPVVHLMRNESILTIYQGVQLGFGIIRIPSFLNIELLLAGKIPIPRLGAKNNNTRM